MLSRRRVLTASGGLLAAAAAGGWYVSDRPATAGSAQSPPEPPPPVGSPLPDADAARRDGWTVVTDFGAVGDGRSRPLSSRYRSLDEARRDFPAAAALTAELDGVAIQTAIDSGTGRVYYPPGRYLHDTALVVRDGQRHLGAGRASTLVNVRRRDTALDDTQAHSFQIGNVHPVAMVVDDPEQAWAVRRLAPITAGTRTVTPVEQASARTGDIVMIRSDNPPTRTGQGVIYDFQMWNRVTGVDPASGALTLELPVPRDIVESSASPTVLAGPRLCLNAGTDRFLGQPWSIVQNVEIGHLALDSAGLSARNGVWRGWFHDLVVDGENMVIFNALVGSVVERVSGTWSARMIEIKHSSHDTVVRDVAGTYRPAAGVVVRPAISIGEQSFSCTFDDVVCDIGPDCRAPIRALELSSPDTGFRGTLRHRGSPDVGQVWAVKSNDSPANPPARIGLDLAVRAGGGFAAYGIVGHDTPRPSYPSDVTLRLDQRSFADPPPVAVLVYGGTGIRATAVAGDSTCATVGAAGTAPAGMDACW